MKENNDKIIWLFGENEGNTLNNNSYFMWEQSAEYEDEIEKYIVVKKTKKNKEIVSKLSKEKQKYVVWKNTTKHWEIYLKADMYWVSLTYKDVTPSKLVFLNVCPGPKKPVIYLQHGTLAIKKIGYTGNSYSNNMFRFLVYNEKIVDDLKKYNEFKDYQLYKQIYHPRYKELLRISEEHKSIAKESKEKQILFFITWREYFGENEQTEKFVKKLEKLLTNIKLQEYLNKNNYKIKLCLHQFFNETNKLNKLKNISSVEIVTPKQVDVMYELATSDVLITDYSSVGFDFTFLNKPVILYQPDLNTYLKYRETYCSIEELKKHSVQNVEELVDNIIKQKYTVNEFFRSRMPKTIDYDYVRTGNHIKKLYDDIKWMQLNSITFVGYNFFGRGGTVSATKALAEALLEKGYLVHLYSLKKIKNDENIIPSGLNIKYAYGPKNRKVELLKRFDRLKRHWYYLKYDTSKQHLIPYAGLALKKFLEHTTSKTVVSTRESLHLFLNDATSKHIQDKIYFFHTDANVANTMYPNLMPEVEKIELSKCAFVTEKNYDAYMNNYNLKGIQKYAVVGNCLQSNNMVEIDQVASIKKKKVYTGITMLRMANDRKQDLDKIIEYGKYLKKNKIQNIKIDVFGMGVLAEQFAADIQKEKISKYITYCGVTDAPSEEIRKRDFLVDFSKHQSFGMTYIEGILNGKKVFATVTNGSKEVLKDMPDSYFETFDELSEKINNLSNVTTKELQENYKKIYSNYSRESVANKFLRLIGGKQ